MTVQGNRGVALTVRAALRSRIAAHSDMTNLQRGIAIGPILFVVAILAVLASAIAAGSGAFNGDTSAVSAKAQATAILEYAEQVKVGVDRVLAKGCKDTEISFENPFVTSDGGYTNANAPSDKSCHVFDVNGGGIVWKNPPDGVNKPSSEYVSEYGSSFIPYIIGHYASIPDIGFDIAELVLYLPITSLGLCQAINVIVGIENIPSSPLYGAHIDAARFRGDYDLSSLGFSPGTFYRSFLPGIRSACAYGSMGPNWFPERAGAPWFFYYVLLVR